jgi:hypothetical protein
LFSAEAATEWYTAQDAGGNYTAIVTPVDPGVFCHYAITNCYSIQLLITIY